MLNPLLLPEIREMLHTQDAAGLGALMNEFHPASISEFCEGLTVEETWQVLASAPIPRQAEVFSFFELDKQVEMVDGVGRERMSRLIEEMSPDNRADLLRELDDAVVESILPLVAKADREDIRRLLSYPEFSAGSVMTSDYATLQENMTIAEAIANVRRQAPDRETIYYLYVIDAERRILGFVSLRDLIVAQPHARVQDIMHLDIVSVRVDQDQEEVAREMGKYDFLAIPVVDEQQRLVGIVTYDDVLDVVVAEATEDAFRMGGVAPIAEAYLDAPFMKIWRNRALWLSCLFVAELFTFTALASFEHAIEKIIALSLFVPLCISTGGNSGSQAASLITRALALGEIEPREWWRVLRHELLMGLSLGVTLGLIGYVRALMTPQAILGNADRWMLALVIGESVAAICLWGTLIGSMLPLLFQKLGIDPGYASSPFVATFVDVTGIVIYFSIAHVYLL